MIDVFSVISMGQSEELGEISIFDWVSSLLAPGLQVTWGEADDDQIVVGLVGLSQQAPQ